MVSERIHITGGSGSGTTTLGRALARALDVPHFDSDTYYWIPTVPPYRIKRDIPGRDARMAEDLTAHDGWIWSGSAVSWEGVPTERITACVLLTLPPDIRLARLRKREIERGCDPAALEEFMAWAARYDEGGLDVRSRALQEQWMSTLACPVLRLDGDLSVEARVDAVLDFVQTNRR